MWCSRTFDIAPWTHGPTTLLVLGVVHLSRLRSESISAGSQIQSPAAKAFVAPGPSSSISRALERTGVCKPRRGMCSVLAWGRKCSGSYNVLHASSVARAIGKVLTAHQCVRSRSCSRLRALTCAVVLKANCRPLTGFRPMLSR